MLTATVQNASKNDSGFKILFLSFFNPISRVTIRLFSYPMAKSLRLGDAILSYQYSILKNIVKATCIDSLSF